MAQADGARNTINFLYALCVVQVCEYERDGVSFVEVTGVRSSVYRETVPPSHGRVLQALFEVLEESSSECTSKLSCDTVVSAIEVVHAVRAVNRSCTDATIRECVQALTEGLYRTAETRFSALRVQRKEGARAREKFYVFRDEMHSAAGP